jgi:hypothetical protein
LQLQKWVFSAQMRKSQKHIWSHKWMRSEFGASIKKNIVEDPKSYSSLLRITSKQVTYLIKVLWILSTQLYKLISITIVRCLHYIFQHVVQTSHYCNWNKHLYSCVNSIHNTLMTNIHNRMLPFKIKFTYLLSRAEHTLKKKDTSMW